MTFDDQTSDGSSIVVAGITTEIDARLGVRNQDAEEWLKRPRGGDIEAGSYEQYEVELGSLLTESAEVSVSLYDDEGSGFARDVATVEVDESVEFTDEIGPTLVEADPAAGFEYPYFLYAPSQTSGAEPRPPLVEPTNTGTASDDLEVHVEAGERTVSSGFSRRIADALGVPFVVPVFPRPEEEPVDFTHYVHQLDVETLSIDDGPLERVDRQLLAMVDDARQRLAASDYPVADGMLLNGFSASGNFVDRFTVLHPEQVVSVTAGGLNGMALLPLAEADGRTLEYHVGIADVEELTGQAVDLDALDDVNQFLYMGAEDENDTIPYDDAWTDDDLRETALAVYGEDMITERFPRCQRAYREVDVSAQFRVYPGVGHTPRPAMSDVIEFHRRSINGEDVGDFGRELTVAARLDVGSEAPAAGEPVEFSASESSGGVDEVVAYQWAFGDGNTATGETATHTYQDSGEYSVTLAIVTDAGTRRETTRVVEVGAAAGGDTSDAPTAGGESDGGTDRAATDGDGPGFGVGGAIGGLVGAGYALHRRVTGEGSDPSDDG